MVEKEKSFNQEEELFINENKLFCISPQNNFEVDIDKIELIQLFRSKYDGKHYLFFYDSHSNSCPIETNGFSKVFKYLKERFKIDEVFYQNILKNNENERHVLWRKMYGRNFKLISNSYNDFLDGFEILETGNDFINWDDTYTTIELNKYSIFSKSKSGQAIIKFINPVRIGNIVTSDLILFYTNGRKDVPVEHYSCHFYDESNSDKSYSELRTALVECLGNSATKYEYDNQKSSTWNFNGFQISLSYSYNCSRPTDLGFTSFSIYNFRVYSIPFSEEEKNSLQNIDKLIEIEDEVFVNNDFRRYNYIRSYPSELEKCEGKAFIWVDKFKERIGFASGDYSVIITLSEIKHFNIQNVAPAKGRGSSFFYATMIDNSKVHLFSGKYNAFDNLTQKVQCQINKEVIQHAEYLDA